MGNRCSLACSKQHKVDTGCNGKRKIDEFVDIREFNVNHLMSDYTYLEVCPQATHDSLTV